ncbi:MAG: glycine--tRNA ligase subunit beta [Terracidiphilus sp.]|jgi:glycyl-tRNA synthetase beta chain
MADFLFEIGLEEMPARMIAGAQAELCKRTVLLLGRERLIDLAGSNVWMDDGLQVDGKQVAKSYSTPRRLAIQVTGLAPKQDDLNELVEGPPVTAAYKNGEPTAAAHAFAKKVGVPIEELLKIQKAKGEYVCARILRRGRTAAEILASELPKEVLSLYWAKNMYWRASKPERFVRPVRWVVALLDAAVVPVEIAGIVAGNASRGHRVLHGGHSVVLTHPREYSEKLRAAFVMVDVAERRQTIRKALDAATRTVAGARWREDAALIETVVHLTEWPSVVLGNFEPEYLALPEEVLVTVMRDHQKYFAVEDADGKLAAHFLAVLNIEVDEEGRANIVRGNERVLRARFKDARFFWDVDQKTPLTERADALKKVTFQKELGSYFEKTSANMQVAFSLHEKLKSMGFERYSFASMNEAVKLAKADLTTELVKEFTELQGIIGGLYARTQGLGETVSQAIYDQYKPASTDDDIPETVEGQLLGLSDRIQTIVAMFSIGSAPTGSKDPFALRRAANAIVKILAESGLPLTLGEVLGATAYKREWTDQREQAAAFLRERLSFYLKDVRGLAYDVVNAVLATGSDDVRDAVARAEALKVARESADFAAISAAFKRIKNILRQAEEKGFDVQADASVALAPEAQQLSDAAAALAPKVAELRQRRAYGEALAEIAMLRPVVDAFFDKVMVLDPDPAIRGANLALIDSVLRGFSGIADFSEIVTA